MEVLAVAAVIASVILLWLNFLATLSVKYDHTLNNFQKGAQLFFVWLIPFIGASFVIHLVYEHSPEAVPKKWIPWPFKKLIYGKPINPNSNRNDNEIDAYGGQYHSRSGSSSDVRGEGGGE